MSRIFVEEYLIKTIKELGEYKYIDEARKEYLRDLEYQNVPHENFSATDFLVGYHKALKNLKEMLRLKCAKDCKCSKCATREILDMGEM